MAEYGRIRDGMFEAAPPVLMSGGARVVRPSAADYLAAGYRPVVDVPPETDEAHYAAPTGWRDLPDRIEREYEVRESPPPPPRRWSRLSIKTALANSGMLAAARAYLAGVEVAPGYTAAEALTDCDYIEEGYPTAERWGEILDGAAQALGKTRVDIDAFLDSLPTE